MMSFALVTVLFLGAVPARAQGTPPETPWSVDVNISWEPNLGGTLLTTGVGVLGGLSTVIEERSWGDVYSTGVGLTIGVGYRLNDRDEVRGVFRYQSKSPDTLQIGNVEGNALFGRFDDYSAWGLEGGYRAYFGMADRKWRPYGEGSLGFTHTDQIQATLTVPNVAAVFGPTDFWQSSTAITIAFGGGVVYQFTERFGVDGRIGFRHLGGLSEQDGLVGTGLENINDETGRWTLPITIGARIAF